MESGAPRGFAPKDVAALAFVGAGAALFAEAFRAILHAVYASLGRESVVVMLERLPFAARVALVLVGCVVGASLARFARRRGEGGVSTISSLVADAGEGDPSSAEARRPLSMRAALVRVVGALAAMGVGASIGREGPIVQFGAALGQRVGERVVDVSVRRRELVAAGTAAGFAAAYNAPIAGVLFVVEVMAGGPARGSVARLSIACGVGALAARALATDTPLYGARTFAPVSAGLFVAAGVVGLVAGVAGVGFVRMLRVLRRIARATGERWLLRAILFGLLAGLVIAFAPRVAGNGYDGIMGLLAAPEPALVVGALCAAKLFATAGSVGSGAPGGVFTPSMFLGAALGLLVHHACTSGGAPLDAGALAFVGMASMIAATTHAPLTATVLAIELSQSHRLALPLLLANGLAMLVARRLDEGSVYGVE